MTLYLTLPHKRYPGSFHTCHGVVAQDSFGLVAYTELSRHTFVWYLSITASTDLRVAAMVTEMMRVPIGLLTDVPPFFPQKISSSAPLPKIEFTNALDI